MQIGNWPRKPMHALRTEAKKLALVYMASPAAKCTAITHTRSQYRGHWRVQRRQVCLGVGWGGAHVREHPCALPPPPPFLPPSLAPLTTHAERVLPLRGWVQAHTVKYAFAGGRYVPQGANK